MKAFVIFALVAIVTLNITNVAGLQCYECESLKDGKCDPPTSSMAINCSHSCIKLWRDEGVIRRCAPPMICKDITLEMKCTSCDTDLCNSASVYGTSAAIVCGLVAVIFAIIQ